MEGYNQVQTKISDWTVGKSTIEKEDLTKEVSDEIKKWDSGAGGAAEAIVALPVHMGARRVNPESSFIHSNIRQRLKVAFLKEE